MLVLMRFATGEDWNSFMYELQNMENCKVSNKLNPFMFFIALLRL